MVESIKKCYNHQVVDLRQVIVKQENNFLFIFPDGLAEDQILFLLHYCASEIYANDFTKRSTAGTCLRDMIHVLKKQKTPEQYLGLLDSAILPVISKGLQVN